MSATGGKRTLQASWRLGYASPVAPNLLIDGMLSGTGVRDAVSGGYVEPKAIGLSASLAAELVAWQRRYEEAHFADFPEHVVAALDDEGLVLASRADAELRGRSVGYFSHGSTKRLA
jgi:hypothetical protein